MTNIIWHSWKINNTNSCHIYWWKFPSNHYIYNPIITRKFTFFMFLLFAYLFGRHIISGIYETLNVERDLMIFLSHNIEQCWIKSIAEWWKYSVRVCHNTFRSLYILRHVANIKHNFFCSFSSCYFQHLEIAEIIHNYSFIYFW